MITLRPYQQRAIDDLRQGVREGHRCQLLALPTGSGKTVIASHIIASARQHGRRALFIVHTKELVAQAVRHFAEVGLTVGVVQGENTVFAATDDVIVATVQSLRNRSPFHWIGLCLIDEAHIVYEQHRKLMTHWSAIPFIGLSATPLTRGLGKLYSRLVRGPHMHDLQDLGALVPLRGYAPSQAVLARILADVGVGNTTHGRDYREADLSRALNTKALVGDIVETYRIRGEGRQALCFAVDIAHSRAIAEDFEANGISAGHIDGYIADDQAADVMDRFKAGATRVLCSVAKLGVGFDFKPVSCAILARPTMSEMLHMQQLGRVLRPADSKVDAVVLDHSGNCVRFGMPADFTVPELDNGERAARETRKTDPKAVTCTDCGYLLDPGQMTCPSCGVDRPVRRADVVYTDADLIKIGSDATGERAYTDADLRRWYLGIRRYWEDRGKEPDHAARIAFAVCAEKFDRKAPRDWRSLAPIPPDRDVMGYIISKRIRYVKGRARNAPVSIGQPETHRGEA